MNDDVVVVDCECMTAAGKGMEETWRNLVANQSGIRVIDRYSPREQAMQGVPEVPYGGQLPLTWEALAGSAAKFQKWCEPGYHAVQWLAQTVLGRIGYDATRLDPQRMGLFGATVLFSHHSQDTLAWTRQPDSKFILNQCHNIPLGVAASEYKLEGPCFSIGSACASSAHAVYLAHALLKAGMLDGALIIGHEFPILPDVVGGLDWVSALYRRNERTDRAYEDPAQASRPFSVDRRGFVLSEGAGAVFLCRAEIARQRDWPVQGRIRGGFSNADADHLTRASVDNLARCMASALKAADVHPDDVECVNAHATSTPLGDKAEMLALSQVLGDRLKRVPVVANKSQLGHTLGASALLALGLAVKGMNEDTLLPTLNHVPDPAMPQAFVPTEATQQRHRVTLLNSFGFGGTNVSLVVDRP